MSEEKVSTYVTRQELLGLGITEDEITDWTTNHNFPEPILRNAAYVWPRTELATWADTNGKVFFLRHN